MSPLWIRRNLSTDQDHALSRNIYQTLALPALATQPNGTLEVSGTKVKPYLAASWTVGKNSITYHLRSGVHFYPSSDPLTATDVKFSLDRIFATPGAGDLESNGLQGASSVQVLNPRRSRSSSPTKTGAPLPITSTQLYMFSQHFTGIVDSKVALDTRRPPIRTRPTGCGRTPRAPARTTSPLGHPA